MTYRNKTEITYSHKQSCIHENNQRHSNGEGKKFFQDLEQEQHIHYVHLVDLYGSSWKLIFD